MYLSTKLRTLMLIKCICSNCAGHLEFEEENLGEKIDCPHCGFETTLAVPGTEEITRLVAARARRRNLRRRLSWIAVGVLVISGLGFVLYHWGLPLVKSFLPDTESAPSPVLVLALVCLVLPFVLVWLILPIFIIFQLRNLTRVLTLIESKLRPLATEEATESHVDD